LKYHLIQTRENTEEYYLAVQVIRNIGYDPNRSGINLNTVIFLVKLNSWCAT